MSNGPMNIHRLVGAVARLTVQAMRGPCSLPGCWNPSVGFIQNLDPIPKGVCERHADQGRRLGYIIHTEAIR